VQVSDADEVDIRRNQYIFVRSPQMSRLRRRMRRGGRVALRQVGRDATVLAVEQALELWAHRAEYYDGFDDEERAHRGGRRDGGGYREIGVL
jgi:hypothetical protein